MTTALWPFKVLYVLHSGCQMMLLRFITTYFVHIGLDTTSIGYLNAMRPLASFVGEVLIASVVDHLHCFRATVLVFNSLGVALFLCMPLATSFSQILAVFGLSMLGVSWMGLRDARVLATLDKQGRGSEFGQVRKFAAVGWGASGLVVGQLQDCLGKFAIFGAFAGTEAVLMLFICFLPMEPPARAQNAEDKTSLLSTLRTADVLLFYSNLFAYGFCASLVEIYLFVFLLRDFSGSSDALAGCTLVVMTLSELPVFQYADRLMGHGYAPVQVFCQWVFALRCLLYAALPASKPWMVLLVEPLHGMTFAAMWASSVEFGRRMAPAGCAARFQAITNGIYFQASFGVGSLFWGHFAAAEGYRPAYRVDALLVVSWGILWGLVMLRRAKASTKTAELARGLLEGSS